MTTRCSRLHGFAISATARAVRNVRLASKSTHAALDTLPIDHVGGDAFSIANSAGHGGLSEQWIKLAPGTATNRCGSAAVRRAPTHHRSPRHCGAGKESNRMGSCESAQQLGLPSGSMSSSLALIE